jgi:hypothetical protein
MWLATRHGWFSCVCGKGKDGKAALDVLMVRAREREHLERLMEHFPRCFPAKAKVVVSDTNDYRFRVIIDRRCFLDLMTLLAADVDYTNFKSEVFKNEGSSEYEKALHRVWSDMAQIQFKKHGNPFRTSLDAEPTWDPAQDEPGEEEDPGLAASAH